MANTDNDEQRRRQNNPDPLTYRLNDAMKESECCIQMAHHIISRILYLVRCRQNQTDRHFYRYWRFLITGFYLVFMYMETSHGGGNAHSSEKSIPLVARMQNKVRARSAEPAPRIR